jgi:hypothetical protein
VTDRQAVVASGAEPRKKGRPRIQFDLQMVEALGRLGATAEEMAHILPASQSTIEHRMSDRESGFYKAYNKGRATLNASLRRKQIELAMGGHPTLLIWLGKQLLDQRDRADLRHATVDLKDLSADQLDALAGGATLEEVVGSRWRRQGSVSLPSHCSSPQPLQDDSDN